MAGQNVLDPTRRWTPGFKQNVYNSRINTTSLLVNTISKGEHKPEVFINISGVSLYKPNDSKIYTEDDPGEDYDFLSKLCIDWEKAATIPPEVNVRNVKIRTGVVLGREGGMIASLYWPFFFGGGGPVAGGQQPLPWIHIDDLCSLIKYSTETHKVKGILNGVAPEIITNAQFGKSFGKALKRPAFFPLPEFVVNFIFEEERAKLLTTGPKVKPKRVEEIGFKYEFPEIDLATKDCSAFFPG